MTPDGYPEFDPVSTQKYLRLYEVVFLTFCLTLWSLGGLVLADASYHTGFTALRFIPSLWLLVFGIYFLMKGLGKLERYRERASNPMIFPVFSVLTLSYLVIGLVYALLAPRSLTIVFGGVILLLSAPMIITPLTVLAFKMIFVDPAEVVRAYQYHLKHAKKQQSSQTAQTSD